MAALVAVMFMVSIGTFDWASLKKLPITPKSDSVVMIVTVITVIATNNLSIGVLVGIILSAIFFASKISKVQIKTLSVEGSQRKIYHVTGQLFFASVTDFVNHFDFKENVKEIDIDLTNSHLWDDSAVNAIDKVVIKYHQNGVKVNLIGLNDDSIKLIDKLAVHKAPRGLDKAVNH